MNNLRRNLEKELAESIHICPDDNGKCILYAGNLSKSELVKRTYALQTELDAMRAESVELASGEPVFSNIRKSQAHLSMAGPEMTMVSSL